MKFEAYLVTTNG